MMITSRTASVIGSSQWAARSAAGGTLRPQEQAEQEEDSARVPLGRVGLVRWYVGDDHPYDTDGEEHERGRSQRRRDQAVDDPARRARDRRNCLVVDRADDALDGAGGTRRPVGVGADL